MRGFGYGVIPFVGSDLDGPVQTPDKKLGGAEGVCGKRGHVDDGLVLEPSRQSAG